MGLGKWCDSPYAEQALPILQVRLDFFAPPLSTESPSLVTESTLEGRPGDLWPLAAGSYGLDLVTKTMIYAVLALAGSLGDKSVGPLSKGFFVVCGRVADPAQRRGEEGVAARVLDRHASAQARRRARARAAPRLIHARHKMQTSRTKVIFMREVAGHRNGK